MRTLNAKITGTNFGVQEDGSMVFYLTMEAAGRVYQVGGISLDTYDEIGRRRVFFGRGIQAIRRVLEVAGVSRWEDLPGTFVRVEESAWGTMVFGSATSWRTSGSTSGSLSFPRQLLPSLARFPVWASWGCELPW